MKGREGQQLLLRFPEGSDLRSRLDDLAKQNNRSLTAEIIHRLSTSLDAEDDGRSAAAARNLLHQSLHENTLEKRLAEIEARVAKLEDNVL